MGYIFVIIGSIACISILFFLVPGFFVSSFIHFSTPLEARIIWALTIIFSLLILGCLYLNNKHRFFSYYLRLSGIICVFVLILTLLLPDNIFINTLWQMFNNEKIENCQRCGGDGTIDAQELESFLRSDVLTDSATICYFQDWMDKNHPLWIKKNGIYFNLRVGPSSEPNRHLGGEGYGYFGNQTKSAYNSYKYECFRSDVSSEKKCLLCTSSGK